jgi:2'-5' RNA ligase
MRSVRTFVGLDFPDELKNQILEVQRSLIENINRKISGIQWTPLERLHLTVFFLGQTPVSRLVDIRMALADITNNCEPFELKFERPGTFPATGRPRIVFLNVADTSGILHELNDKVSNVLAGFGYERPKTHFHPHVTLGRMRRGRENRQNADIVEILRTTNLTVPPPSFIDELTFFQSVPNWDGPRYEPLARFLLQVKPEFPF